MKLVYLRALYDVTLNRLKLRQGHYGGEKLLHSQFTDLEEPTDALILDASLPPDEIVRELRRLLTPAP